MLGSVIAYLVAGKWALVIAIPMLLTATFGIKAKP